MFLKDFFEKVNRRQKHEKITQHAKSLKKSFDFFCRLQNEKRNLNMKAEEMGRMQRENEEMTEQIEQLHESHK